VLKTVTNCHQKRLSERKRARGDKSRIVCNDAGIASVMKDFSNPPQYSSTIDCMGITENRMMAIANLRKAATLRTK